MQNSGNILLITPEEADLNRFRQAFVRHYNVFTASSIRKGHRIINDYDIHVLLVNQQMPDMTGLQFCESISHEYPEIIKIILNDTDESASLERAAQTDLIYRFVKKPYQPTDLKMSIDGAIKLSEAQYRNKELYEELNRHKSERENIISLFKRYVPSEVVSQALSSTEDHFMRPGETRVVSVLFADIRGFTKFTSTLRPEQVVEFLNDYWEIITECIRLNKGSVNKYMGDGLLAIFGAPVSYLDNHKNAVNAALEMVGSLKDINAMYSDIIGTDIKIGVGINSGEVIVGNIGTDNYMEYTVIGDTVNVASRLETISKKKPNSILISERTYELVKDDFETGDMKRVKISGKEEELVYCEVTGEKPGNVYNLSTGQNPSAG